jgi:hypothetical protein
MGEAGWGDAEYTAASGGTQYDGVVKKILLQTDIARSSNSLSHTLADRRVECIGGRKSKQPPLKGGCWNHRSVESYGLF